jgi:hypothetical protein
VCIAAQNVHIPKKKAFITTQFNSIPTGPSPWADFTSNTEMPMIIKIAYDRGVI